MSTEATAPKTDLALDGWRKSTFSGGNSDNCAYVRPFGEGVQFMDSEDPAGTVVTMPKASFAAFVAGCKAGEFDQL